MRTRGILSALVYSLTVLAVVGQEATPAPATPRFSSPAVPVVNIIFRQDEIPAIAIGDHAVWDYPLQCGGGRYFIDLFLPPNYEERQLYAFSKDHTAVRYSIRSARDLFNVVEKAYLPTDSGVTFLVTATRSDRKGKYIIRRRDGSTEERTGPVGEFQDFLVRFDRDGICRGAAEIDRSLMVSSIAMFDSGTYLVLGQTVRDHLLQLAVLDSDGTLLRLIDPGRTLEKTAKMEGKAIENLPYGVAPWVQLLKFRGRLLVVPHSKGTVLEVSPGGDVRTMKLRIPVGLEIDSFLASADHWYVRVGDPIKMNEAQNTSKNRMFELDPETGEVLRELKAEDITVGEIACEEDGEFVAFRLSETGSLMVLRGNIQ